MAAGAITKTDLFARLAKGHAARVTVVTPNARLARELAREFDAGQAAKGLAVWETADILPLPSFAERLYEDALYSDQAAKLPILLTDAQAQALWEAAIRESRWGEALLAVPQAAAEAERAWALAQGWRIDGALASFPGNDDARAFAEWAKDYARRCVKAGATDRARLPDVVAPLLKEEALRRPKLLVLYSFDELKPQDRDFLDACGKAGIELRACAPERRSGKAAKRAYPSARAELCAAAEWARARLEEGAKRVGVVVPQLGERRKEVARVFARTLHPGHNLPAAEQRSLPFNISLGAPLDDYPLARAALSILELSTGEIPFEQASRLIRSPMIAGASSEMARRAQLDAALRRIAPAKLGLGKLVGLIEGAPALRQCLEKLFAVPRQENVSPHDWARHFTALLEAFGFPGDRPLDSAEHQARAKFNEQLAELAKLERVAPRMSLARALASLRRLCADTLFQPESPDAPIQVLGVLESLGLEFDALWVSGLTDEAWPMHTRANPFIPPALQRKAGIREASPEATLEWAKKVTENWLNAADEVVLSHPARADDRELLASPLISGVPGLSGTPETRSVARYRDVIFAARRVERVPDGQAPVLATKTPKGGTRILADQAACPFRAFARHRLNAEALEEPVEGLDARARGLLLHTLMKELWSQLKGSEGLEGNVSAAVRNAAGAAVAEAKLEEPFARLERERLVKLANEWLEVERERPPFTVVAMEDKRKLSVAGLELSGRIDRLDALESGGHALIDYKTGNPTPNDWQGERPEDPQLPLYALSAAEDVSAVAYAKLKTGAMRYMGFSRAKDAISKVRVAENWATLFAGWKKELEALGQGFASGDARVDPKKLLSTCRYCDLQPLCRVYERVNALEESGEEA
ncbi:MAG: PD-(D/E)XK nuclease family protein [Betaproteobacteria bacterium]|nr:PD-(D/E)XK nuclease family protein [Betaproteobacteria bacterium]